MPTLDAISQDIDHCAQRAGRPAGSVRLIAVSKSQPAAAIAALAAQGQRAFGENYAQEAMTKIPALATAGLEWHFLGPVQRNKARIVSAHFDWLHSLDSLPLAHSLARHLQTAGRTLEVLIGVNSLEDGTKQGLTREAVPAFLDGFLADPALARVLHLRGLMTIGPHQAPADTSARCFGALRDTLETCARRFALPQFDQLSMGMSDDYRIAIAEGATMVRIGRALFGERPRKA
ncbi:MAG: YggS family pyridoxal phosphate-dependent enzyme [Gammaproteobacteria bacterium]|nr:YggS family pyridoxal phosphate-dependent enzyme [Gammaproteobacteria bacterium]